MLSAVFSMCLWWEAVCVLMIVSVDTFGVKKTHSHDRPGAHLWDLSNGRRLQGVMREDYGFM